MYLCFSFADLFSAYSVMVMHRRTDLWGPDGVCTQLKNFGLKNDRAALQWDPERFIDERLHKYRTCPLPGSVAVFHLFNSNTQPVYLPSVQRW